MLERIRGLVGEELATRLLKIEETTLHGVTVSGYIGGPGMSRSNRQMQTTYLNGRPIESASISYGLREGYHTALMKGQYPITILFIQMDPTAFDVNVHPAKKEVRFHDGNSVRDAIARSVSRTLENASKLHTGHAPAARPLPVASIPAPVIPVSRQEELEMPVAPSSAPLRQMPAVSTPNPVRAPSPPRPIEPVSAPEVSLPKPVENAKTASSDAPSPNDFRIIGVLQKLYVLMESKEGLVLMDQHAAHERVNFEKFRRALESGGVPCQRLLMPITLQTTPRDADVLKQNQAALTRLGIEIEPFGPNIFKVEALPSFLKTDDPAAWLDQVIEELSSLTAKASSLRLSEDAIATTACRASVKSNDVLSIPELQALLKDLFACEMPYCCPHGRPTLVQISTAELERKFGRRAPG
jgi:DNA mismatch repair protein MutL